MSISSGDKLSPYEILAPIGAGGIGEVWKARDTRLDRIVAIKKSHICFTERFEREAHAIAALNHPHICQLYDVRPDYRVMEYVEASRLKALCRWPTRCNTRRRSRKRSRPCANTSRCSPRASFDLFRSGVVRFDS